MSEIDAAIAEYRHALDELGAPDLDELEDHLRALTAELVAEGLPAAGAVREACRRFGDVALLAREHARVRSPFGPVLPAMRRWSAALLVLPFLLFTGAWWFELVMGTALVIALVAGMTWARPILLGTLIPTTLHVLAACVLGHASALVLAELVCFAGATAFLVPWRRGELPAPGLALALAGPAYAAAATLFQYQLTDPSGARFGHTTATCALVAIVAGSTGILLRARWAALACAVAAIALARLTIDVWPLVLRFAHGGVWHGVLLGSLAVGIVTVLAAAVIAVRTARTTFGSLQSVRL